MGIIEKTKKLIGGNSKKRFECNQGEDGKIVCESFREFDDGTRENLAEIEFQFDGQCHGVATHFEENKEGELKELENKVVGRLKEKCKTTKPGDY